MPLRSSGRERGTLMFHTSKEPTENAGRRGAARTRIVGQPVRQQQVQPPLDAAGELLIRVARADDRPALDDLAARDSRPRLQGDALIAELDGVIVAAGFAFDDALAAPLAATPDRKSVV